MKAGEAIIEVEGLTKLYGMRPALKAVSFRVARGETVVLLGENGSGKSTLLRLLAGLSRPSAGFIRIGGWEMPKEAMALRRQIGLVAHQPLLYGKLSARENLDFFGKLYHIPAVERADRIAEMLRQVGLQKRGDSLAGSFSRGMRQRLSIARALLHEPEILLLDEPFTGLDQAASETLAELVRATGQAERTLILSTHQLERAANMNGRAMILSRGKLAFDGGAKSMRHDELRATYHRLCGGAALG